MSDRNKERFPFQYGPRDNGPADPPPWPKIVMMFFGLAVCITSACIAYNYEWIGGVYVKGPLVGAFIAGFLMVVAFIGEGFDEGLAEEQRRQNDEEE